MKNLKGILLRSANVLCMAAMFVAMHSANIRCTGKFYQPVAPKALDRFKKF